MIHNRTIFNEINGEINKDNNKIIILIGARQVGKTTIMKYFFKKLKEKKQKTIFLDLDIYSNYEKVETYEKFINYLTINWYKKEENENCKKQNKYSEEQNEYFQKQSEYLEEQSEYSREQNNYYYVFLDEFQRYDNFTKILKNIYDNNKNIKIIASWSSSINIKNNIQESLAWRKRIINIFPLNYEEFLLFKWAQNLYKNYKNIKNITWSDLYPSLKEYYDLLYEFMIYWWYPAVVLENNFEEKQKILWDIFDLFIKKDLWEYLKIDKIKIVKDILKYIAINNWSKLKYEEISKISNVSIHTIKNYVEILKELFIFIELKPYFKNKNLELVKIPKIYFIDNWVRNYFIKNFIEIDLRNDNWALFEWYIIWEFLKSKVDIESLKYWNHKNKKEVDIIIDNISSLDSYEVKFKKNIKSKDLSWLKVFWEMYKVKWNLINLWIKSKNDKYNFILPFGL